MPSLRNQTYFNIYLSIIHLEALATGFSVSLVRGSYLSYNPRHVGYGMWNNNRLFCCRKIIYLVISQQILTAEGVWICYKVSNVFHALPHESLNVTGSYKIPSMSTKTWPVSPDCIFSCTKIHLVRETNVCPDPNLAFVALFCVALCCVALGKC